MEKIFGILACPAGHSLSPVMHSAGFKALGLDYGFAAWDVRPEELRDFVGALKRRESVKLSAGEFDLAKAAGFSVSMPHKESIIPLLNGLDDAGAAVGAVSCVYERNGEFIGTNLDYMGVNGSLLVSDYALREGLVGKKVIVLGAGGAAKAAVYGLLKLGMIPVIVNRTLEKAEIIADRFSTDELMIEAYALDAPELNSHGVEIIINCTSLGLGDDKQLVSEEIFSNVKLSLDAVYCHEPTIFQTLSKAAGAETLTGLEWLLHQGYEAFRLWTGFDAPQEVMRAAVTG